jgi:hypothetical protein
MLVRLNDQDVHENDQDEAPFFDVCVEQDLVIGRPFEQLLRHEWYSRYESMTGWRWVLPLKNGLESPKTQRQHSLW